MRLHGLGEGSVCGGGHPGPLHGILRKRLGALEARAVAVGPHDELARGPKSVAQPLDQRPLGSDHDEIRRQSAAQLDQPVVVIHPNGPQRRAIGRARIAGRHMHLALRREPPRERVLPSTAADHQTPHTRNLPVCVASSSSRPHRLPHASAGCIFVGKTRL